MRNKQTSLAFALIFGVLLADQLLKLWVKSNFVLGEEWTIFPWFKLHFVENKGMAFGMELGGQNGKLLLTLFRLVALSGMVYFLRQIIRSGQTTWGLVVSISLILAGAAGNLVDSLFYGLLFSDSTGQVATFLPAAGGYAPFMHGKVVDMFYFPIYNGFLPAWVPFYGHHYVQFFRHVFNIADLAITVGVLMVVVLQGQFFKAPKSKTTSAASLLKHPCGPPFFGCSVCSLRK